MDEHAYRVGAAVEYLVRRMETFCTVSGTDVFMYEGRVRAGIPVRMSATDVMRGRARNYGIHRELYPEDHQEILYGITGGRRSGQGLRGRTQRLAENGVYGVARSTTASTRCWETWAARRTGPPW
jgi:hypothetical protein